MDSKNFRTLEEKWEMFKWRAEQEKNKVVRFCKEHPQGAVLGVSTLIGGVSFAGKRICKAVDTKKAVKLVECRHYDRRTDTYWFSKRPLKTSEKLMLDKLYSEGRNKGDILNDMGLLK